MTAPVEKPLRVVAYTHGYDPKVDKFPALVIEDGDQLQLEAKPGRIIAHCRSKHASLALAAGLEEAARRLRGEIARKSKAAPGYCQHPQGCEMGPLGEPAGATSTGFCMAHNDRIAQSGSLGRPGRDRSRERLLGREDGPCAVWFLASLAKRTGRGVIHRHRGMSVHITWADGTRTRGFAASRLLAWESRDWISLGTLDPVTRTQPIAVVQGARAKAQAIVNAPHVRSRRRAGLIERAEQASAGLIEWSPDGGSEA